MAASDQLPGGAWRQGPGRGRLQVAQTVRLSPQPRQFVLGSKAGEERGLCPAEAPGERGPGAWSPWAALIPLPETKCGGPRLSSARGLRGFLLLSALT